MSTDLMNIPTGTSNSDDLSDQRIGNDVELRELVYQSLERDGSKTRSPIVTPSIRFVISPRKLSKGISEFNDTNMNLFQKPNGTFERLSLSVGKFSASSHSGIDLKQPLSSNLRPW